MPPADRSACGRSPPPRATPAARRRAATSSTSRAGHPCRAPSAGRARSVGQSSESAAKTWMRRGGQHEERHPGSAGRPAARRGARAAPRSRHGRAESPARPAATSSRSRHGASRCGGVAAPLGDAGRGRRCSARGRRRRARAPRAPRRSDPSTGRAGGAGASSRSVSWSAEIDAAAGRLDAVDDHVAAEHALAGGRCRDARCAVALERQVTVEAEQVRRA